MSADVKIKLFEKVTRNTFFPETGPWPTSHFNKTDINTRRCQKYAEDRERYAQWTELAIVNNFTSEKERERERRLAARNSDKGGLSPAEDPGWWTGQAELIAQTFLDSVNKNPKRYLQLLCEEFKDHGNKSSFFENVRSISNLQDSLQRCQKGLHGANPTDAEQKRVHDIEAELVLYRSWVSEIWKAIRASAVDAVKRFLAGEFAFQTSEGGGRDMSTEEIRYRLRYPRSSFPPKYFMIIPGPMSLSASVPSLRTDMTSFAVFPRPSGACVAPYFVDIIDDDMPLIHIPKFYVLVRGPAPGIYSRWHDVKQYAVSGQGFIWSKADTPYEAFTHWRDHCVSSGCDHVKAFMPARVTQKVPPTPTPTPTPTLSLLSSSMSSPSLQSPSTAPLSLSHSSVLPLQPLSTMTSAWKTPAKRASSLRASPSPTKLKSPLTASPSPTKFYGVVSPKGKVAYSTLVEAQGAFVAHQRRDSHLCWWKKSSITSMAFSTTTTTSSREFSLCHDHLVRYSFESYHHHHLVVAL
ncbi:hypothetical protein C8J56DRAFT_1062715 [Mycena floridula]|nr:hypothetical protein C8J56DRAFT_1062715 [Mycena floridula]